MMDGSQVIEATGFIKANGMKFPKDGALLKRRMRGLLKDGTYKAKEGKNLLKVVRDDDVVVELGAGLGYTSTLIATKRKIKRLHAFEADPTLVPYIEAVHLANGVENASVTHAIWGKRKGSTDFFVRKNFLTSSTTTLEGSKVTSTEKVDVLNAKTMMSELTPTVLVCDLKGGEAELIPELDLKSLRAAFVEFHPHIIGPEGVNMVFKAFMDAGLAYYARASSSKAVAFRRTW